MGRKKLSMSEKIRRYIAANPNAKAQDIAKELDVKVSLVYAVKYKKPNKVSPAVPKAKPVDIDAVHKKDVVQKTWSTLTVTTSDTPAKPDVVNHPPHYTAGGIETIDFMQAKLTREEFIGYLKGNALKYASRVGKKDNADIDAGKMAWYAMKLRDMLSIQP